MRLSTALELIRRIDLDAALIAAHRELTPVDRTHLDELVGLVELEDRAEFRELVRRGEITRSALELREVRKRERHYAQPGVAPGTPNPYRGRRRNKR